MNTTTNTIARKFFSFASIAMMSAFGLGGCIAGEQDMADLEDEMADESDESDENVAEDSEAITSLPRAVYMNMDFNSMGYQEGRYILGTAANGTNCWIHEKSGAGSKSNYSIGAVLGNWYLFFIGNCAHTSSPLSLGAQTTSDPLQSSYVDVAPKAVTVAANSLPAGSRGDYVKASSNGLSQAQCWNQVNGTYSLARYADTWYVFPGHNCTNVSTVVWIGPATNNDPTTLAPTVDITYKYYSAWPW